MFCVANMLPLFFCSVLFKISEAFNFSQNDYVLEFLRVELGSFDKDYFDDMKIITYKYNRTQPVVNATFTIKGDFKQHLEAVVQGYTFLSNEYREFPIRFEYNLCTGLRQDLFGIGNVYHLGNFPKCPMKRGRYHISKWHPDQAKFPPYIPSGNYMLSFEFLYFDKVTAVVNAYGEVKRPILPKD